MKNGQSFGFARLNSGKRSVAIDLRSDAGRDLIRRLAAQVDVVIENFRPAGWTPGGWATSPGRRQPAASW